MSENKITFPVKLASNNPKSFGIVDATEISGHRSVDTISELYAISDSILSILKDGSDAIGQEWFVVSEDCKYRLDNWGNRKSVSGWTKLPKQELIDSKQSVSEKDKPSGYAGLDYNGKLPIEKTYGTTATVVDVATYESLPVTGLSGVIYYVSNTSAQYKWSGSAYIDITDGADNAKKNETSIFDCSNGTSTKYYSSLSDAINVVPPAYRSSNRIISYLSTENSTTSAVNYQYHGIDSTTWTDLTKWERVPNQADLAEIRSDLNVLQNKTLNIDYINYPFAISDINGNIVYLVDFGGIINNDELEGIYSNIDSLSTLLNGFIPYVEGLASTIFNCNYPFAVADSNGNVAFLVSYDGATINNENKEFDEKLNFRINSEIAINSEVVSPLNFIHAFSVSAVSKNGGDIFFIYMASNVNVDEHYTSDASWIELSKFNICKPSETTDIQVIKHGDIFDGVTVYNPYNMLVTKSVDESIIYCHFGCIPAGETTPVYATIPVNPSTLEKGTFQQNTLTYSVNGSQKTVKYSMDNYLTMLYEMGLTDSKIEYGDDRKTTDNSIPYFYNGKFYKVESHSADTILPIILVSSVNMINWDYEKVIASGFKADELSLVIKDDIIYVSFRQDGGDGMRYYVYDSNNDVELASGRFDDGILSRPMTFSYKNEVYMIINTKPTYYRNTSVPTFDLANRQEVSIFKVVNNIPSLIGKMTNPNGINYHYELPFRGASHDPYGDFIGEESLYMFFSEDRRKIWQVRQFSDIAFCNITNILNIK